MRAQGKSSADIQQALDDLRSTDPDTPTDQPFDPGTQFDPTALKRTIEETRIKLKSDFKREGNMAAAEIEIDGLPELMIAHSRISDLKNLPKIEGFVAVTNNQFKTGFDYNKAGDSIERSNDTEVKILDNIAQRLDTDYLRRGRINIFTEVKVCKSCESVINQFRKRYPNITINVMDNNGNRLSPQNKGK